VALAVGVAVTAASAVTVATANTPVVAQEQGDSSPDSQVLRFDVRFSPFNVIDVTPPQGDGTQPGDYAVFSDRLINQAGEMVGRQGGSGLVTRLTASGAEIFFDLAIRLHNGQIAAQGLSSTAASKRIAVVGGTGAYTGADGHLVLVENGDGTGTLTITLVDHDDDYDDDDD
jgi:hypothetical protein